MLAWFGLDFRVSRYWGAEQARGIQLIASLQRRVSGGGGLENFGLLVRSSCFANGGELVKGYFLWRFFLSRCSGYPDAESEGKERHRLEK